ncbi:MAG: Dabb family protein [Pseudolysinimonas sp.]
MHMVSFRWKDEVTDEQVTELTAALTAMAAGVPEVRSYRCGANLRVRPSTADFGVAVLVDDETGLVAYLDSAAHVDVFTRLLQPMFQERSAVQLQVGENATL